MTDGHPLASIGWSFAAGAVGGVVFVCGCAVGGVTLVTTFLDHSGDGIGVTDTAIVGWLGGNLAVLAHCILPGIARH